MSLAQLGPVVAFLVTILVVSDVCSRAGLFVAAAQRVGRWSGGHPVRLFTGVFVLAALVTVTLSLDATVVLLTPVVLAAALARAVPYEPGTFACLRMANSASLLLPVSNLTNLLALPSLDLTFTGFAARMAPVLLVVLAVEYVGLRLLFRPQLRAIPEQDTDPPAPVPVFPLVVVSLMLAGFAAVSPFGGERGAGADQPDQDLDPTARVPERDGEHAPQCQHDDDVGGGRHARSLGRPVRMAMSWVERADNRSSSRPAGQVSRPTSRVSRVSRVHRVSRPVGPGATNGRRPAWSGRCWSPCW